MRLKSGNAGVVVGRIDNASLAAHLLADCVSCRVVESCGDCCKAEDANIFEV